MAEYPKDILLLLIAYSINDACLHYTYYMSNTRILQSFVQTRRGGTGGVHVTLKLDPSINSLLHRWASKAFCQAYNGL